MNKSEPQNRVPNLTMPADLEAVYSNLVRISHTPAEIVFDFSVFLPGQNEARVISRLLMSPMGAKLFYQALGENLAKYESVFGQIPTPGAGTLASDLFRGVAPPPTKP